jgi:hypothetical protein
VFCICDGMCDGICDGMWDVDRAVIGLVDTDKEMELELSSIRAKPLKHVSF